MLGERLQKAAQLGDGLRSERLTVATQRVEDRAGIAFQLGEPMDLLADPAERAEQAVAEVPFPPQAVDDLVSGTPARHHRDQGAEEPVDPRVVASIDLGGDGLDVAARLEPAGELFEPEFQRGHAAPFGGGLAEPLDQGPAQRAGKARAIEHFEDQSHMPEPDARAGDPGLGECPVGQPDHLGVGERAAVADSLDADLLELAEPAGTGGLISEDRPRVADPPGERRRDLDGGVRPDDPGRQLGTQTDPLAAAGKFEQLRHDPRAALSRVQFGRFQHGGPQRLIPGPREAVQKQGLQRSQPRAIVAEPVASAAHGLDRPLGRARGLGDRSAVHRPSPSRTDRCDFTESTSNSQERPFCSARVFKSRRLNVPAATSSGPTITASRWPRVDP